VAAGSLKLNGAWEYKLVSSLSISDPLGGATLFVSFEGGAWTSQIAKTITDSTAIIAVGPLDEEPSSD
jgi:hypothetical protein